MWFSVSLKVLFIVTIFAGNFSKGLPVATIGCTSRPQCPQRPRDPRRLSASVVSSVAVASQLRRGVKAKNKEDLTLEKLRLSNEKQCPWFFLIWVEGGDEILPSYVGIMIMPL